MDWNQENMIINESNHFVTKTVSRSDLVLGFGMLMNGQGGRVLW